MSESLHIVCPLCDTVNRIPAARLSDGPKCGRCHRSLFRGHPHELTAANFQKQITRNDIPVLVDFWAYVISTMSPPVIWNASKTSWRTAAMNAMARKAGSRLSSAYSRV